MGLLLNSKPQKLEIIKITWSTLELLRFKKKFIKDQLLDLCVRVRYPSNQFSLASYFRKWWEIFTWSCWQSTWVVPSSCKTEVPSFLAGWGSFLHLLILCTAENFQACFFLRADNYEQIGTSQAMGHEIHKNLMIREDLYWLLLTHEPPGFSFSGLLPSYTLWWYRFLWWR